MNENLKVYKPKKTSMLGGLFVLAIVFFGLTLPVLVEGNPIETGKLVGLSTFWLLGILITIVPLTSRLEVGDGIVRTYFLGLKTRELSPSNIQKIEYGNIFRAGGLGAGKGLKIWEQTKRGSKYFSLGEKSYGKEAIDHVKRVLERR